MNMATQDPKKQNLLYLDQITLQHVPNRQYTLRLFVENVERELQKKDDYTWTPAQRQDVSPTSQIRAGVRMKSGHSVWAKYQEASEVIDLHGLFSDYWRSNNHEFTLLKPVVIGKHSGSLKMQFSANQIVEALRSSLQELEELLKEYSPLMSGSIEKSVDRTIQYAAVFAELNPIAKAVFGVANVTFELLKEQNKYDQMPSGLCDRMQRILPLAKQAADEIVSEETKILKGLIPQMFEVMFKVAKISCDYVKRARTIGDLAYPEMIEEMDKELTKVIDDFDRAMKFEALRLANETKEQELLSTRLKPVEAGYHLKLRCMDDTRTSLLNQIMGWVANKSGQESVLQRNTYWFYGSPGIGKTSLAHSICANLDDRDHLAGAIFCRRDDPILSEPINILPTFIYKLAMIFPPFRTIVAKHLRDHSNLTPESMKDTLFLDFIRSLPHHPEHPLVFVIDALDECGDAQSRTRLLEVLTNTAAQAPWLKIVITSRPEVDIQQFFDTLTQSSYLYDLATDQDANADLQTFARSQFDLVASIWCLDTPWPKEPDFSRVISRAKGLFIFIKTLVLALKHCEDPEEGLKAALQESSGTGLESLYELYSSILRAQNVHKNADFQRMVGVLLTTSPYRPLCEETIAELAGVKPYLVKKWVNTLSSLLYRDETANRGIRVRHLSVYDFFFSDRCGFQVNAQDANVQLGNDCLRVMTSQLRFNICELEDSRLANTEVGDLPSRLKQNVSDPLQYSCLYWSNHLCFPSDTRGQCALVLGSLKKFFEGLFPVFWIEVLSIMGMVSIGAPSLRRLLSLVRDADSTLLERIQDIGRFLITFHTAISFSTPHIYISTRPFLPSQSPLSRMFNREFTGAIKMRAGKLTSWPAPPLRWTGHTEDVVSVRYSPDGTRVVTGSFDKTIRIWDAESGAVIGEPLTGHTSGVSSIAYSPDGRHIISGSDDRTIRIWDAESGAAIGEPLTGHTSGVSSVAYSPDGRHIISGSYDDTIQIWDAKTGAVAGNPIVGHTHWVSSVAFSPNGRHIISGSSDRTVRIWDAKTGAAVGDPLKGHTQWVTSVAYSPNGRHIISGSYDRTIRIWDAKTGAAVGNPLEGHTQWVTSVAYSPIGRHIISGSYDNTIRTWDAETGAAVGNPIVGHTHWVSSVAYSPDGRHIISGSDDRTIRIWDAKNGAAVGKPREGHTHWVSSVVYSPDGCHIISGSCDDTIRIWDAKTGAAVGNPLDGGHTDSVSSIAYSPNGRHIISGSYDRTIRIWDAKTGAVVGGPLEGHTQWVSSVAYSPDGRHIISGSDDRTIRIWDAETGAAVSNPLEGHTDEVSSVAYSPDGRHIISGSSDRTIRIWDAETGDAVGNPLEGHTDSVSSIAYSPDGRYVTSGSYDCTIRIWDAKTGAAVGNPLEGHTYSVWSVAYSPDGRHITSGSYDRTIRIWDAKTGAVVGNPLQGHADSVSSVAYSPDGRHITSGSYDRTIRIWDAGASTAASKPFEGHTDSVQSIAYSSDGQNIVSGSCDNTTRVWDAFSYAPIRPSSCNPINPDFLAKPHVDGWVRDSKGGLLYWVPHENRTTVHSPALMTIPLSSRSRSVSLDFDDIAFGTSWTQISQSAPS